MLTKVVIDTHLLDEAQRLGGHRTRRATVIEALEEYIKRRKQAQGTNDLAPYRDRLKR